MAAPNWFVGLPVAAGAWFDALPPPPPAVRRFAAQDLHITVAFLGGVDEPAARAAFALAEHWPLGPTQVCLTEVVALGSRRRPSALSALLVEPAPIAEAIAAVRAGMWEAAGAEPETRPPRPHVTLARVGRRASQADFRRALAWAAALELGRPRLTLDRIALYTRAREQNERLYDRILQRELNDPPAAMG